MRRLLLTLSPALRLTRVSTAFAAVANVWFIILWTRAAGTHEPGVRALNLYPEWLLLVGGALNAIGLFGFATTLNDVLDHRRDQALHPDRPIPSGRVSLDAAITLVVGTLGAAILGATLLGMPAVVLTVVIAGAVFLFNAAGKFVPGFGLLLLGLVYAGQMVIPNLNLRFVWPVWLVMTHALAVAGIRHVVSGRPPALSVRALVFALTGWAFWSAVMFGAGAMRSGATRVGIWRALWPEWVSWKAAVGPGILVLLFLGWTWAKVRTLGRGPRAGDKVARYGALWLALYSCAWLFGQGYRSEAAILGVLAGAGLLGMTVMREAYALIEHPVSYRQ